MQSDWEVACRGDGGLCVHTHSHAHTRYQGQSVSDVGGAAGGHTDGGWRQSSLQETQPINPMLRGGWSPCIAHSFNTSFIHLLKKKKKSLPHHKIHPSRTIFFNENEFPAITGSQAGVLSSSSSRLCARFHADESRRVFLSPACYLSS